MRCIPGFLFLSSCFSPPPTSESTSKAPETDADTDADADTDTDADTDADADTDTDCDSDPVSTLPDPTFGSLTGYDSADFCGPVYDAWDAVHASFVAANASCVVDEDCHIVGGACDLLGVGDQAVNVSLTQEGYMDFVRHMEEEVEAVGCSSEVYTCDLYGYYDTPCICGRCVLSPK